MVNIRIVKSNTSKLLLTGITLAFGLACAPSQAGGIFSRPQKEENKRAALNEQLLETAEDGNERRVEKLLENCADVNTQNTHGNTALIEAAKFGHINTVRLLLETQGVNINAQNTDNSTALIEAASFGHINIVRPLLAVPKIKVNVQDKYGRTALIWAAIFNKTNIVRLLLEDSRIDVNAQDKCGNTALQNARQTNNTDLIQLLETYIRATEQASLPDATTLHDNHQISWPLLALQSMPVMAEVTHLPPDIAVLVEEYMLGASKNVLHKYLKAEQKRHADAMATSSSGLRQSQMAASSTSAVAAAAAAASVPSFSSQPAASSVSAAAAASSDSLELAASAPSVAVTTLQDIPRTTALSPARLAITRDLLAERGVQDARKAQQK